MTAQPLDGPRGFVPRAELYAALKRVDELEAEVAELRAELRPKRDHELVGRLCETGFSFGQSLVLALLVNGRGPVETGKLIRDGGIGTIWDAGRERDTDNLNQCLKVQMSHLRHRWRRLGGPADPIRTVRLVGYVMTAEARRWCLERVGRATDDPDAIAGHSKARSEEV